MNKPVYLALSISEISKIVMSEFCCDYMKPKFGKNKFMLHGYRQLYSLHQKQKVVTQTFQKILELNLILQIMN